MSEKQKKNDSEEEGSTTVRNHALMAAGLGLLPVPLWDLAAVIGMQTSMMYKLCHEHGVEFSKARATSIATSLMGGLTAASLATGLAGSLLKAIPYVGSVVGALNFSVWAGATTYAIGRVFDNHLASGGTLLTFDPKKAKEAVAAAYEKGKVFVSRKKAETA